MCCSHILTHLIKVWQHWLLLIRFWNILAREELSFPLLTPIEEQEIVISNDETWWNTRRSNKHVKKWMTRISNDVFLFHISNILSPKLISLKLSPRYFWRKSQLDQWHTGPVLLGPFGTCFWGTKAVPFAMTWLKYSNSSFIWTILELCKWWLVVEFDDMSILSE